MNKYLLSIIIPTLNEEKYLPHLLEDLARQHEQNFEVIVVDACSEDNTKKGISPFREKFPLRFLSSSKRNVAFQRNHAVKFAKGNYLIFLDADCRVLATFTKRLSIAIAKYGGLLFLPSLAPDVNTPKNKLIFTVVNAVVEASQSIGRPLPTASAMFMEKSFFTMIGGYSENTFVGEDHDFVLRAKRWGVRAKFLKDVRVIFSLRRARKEGEIVLFSKYVTLAMLMFVNKKVTKSMFQYEMGGHIFSDDEQVPLRVKKAIAVKAPKLSRLS